MKTDLATAIIAGVLGIVVAYFVTNIFIPPIEDFTYTTVDSSFGVDLIDPNIEIFNYKALNPTVEVYVGNCTEYNENGECIEDIPTYEEVPEDTPAEDTPTENTTPEDNSTPNSAPEENSAPENESEQGA